MKSRDKKEKLVLRKSFRLSDDNLRNPPPFQSKSNGPFLIEKRVREIETSNVGPTISHFDH